MHILCELNTHVTNTHFTINTAHASYVATLLSAKESSGKTFDQIAHECGWTNGYTTQLFFGQAQLKKAAVDRLRAAVPALTNDEIVKMQRAAQRRFDPAILQVWWVFVLVMVCGGYTERHGVCICVVAQAHTNTYFLGATCLPLL